MNSIEYNKTQFSFIIKYHFKYLKETQINFDGFWQALHCWRMQFDIYDDLVTNTTSVTNETKNKKSRDVDSTGLQPKVELLEKEYELLQDDKKHATQKIEILTKENEILKRNISALFKTAQLEIKRKDEEIKRLREE